MSHDHLNNELKVCYSHNHSNNRPYGYWTHLNHLNTTLICYPNPDCIWIPDIPFIHISPVAKLLILFQKEDEEIHDAEAMVEPEDKQQVSTLGVLSCALFWRTKHKLWGT